MTNISTNVFLLTLSALQMKCVIKVLVANSSKSFCFQRSVQSPRQKNEATGGPEEGFDGKRKGRGESTKQSLGRRKPQ